MNLKNVKVLFNKPVGASCFKLRMSTGYEKQGIAPGQFVMIQVPGKVPLLRRPFSIHRVIDDENGGWHAEVLIKIVGSGTRRLSEVKEGEGLNVFGPLGKGFEPPDGSGPVYVVGGGIGIAPLLYLVEELLARKWSAGRIVLFFGARTADEAVLARLFEKLGVDMRYSTDDGTLGHKGLVTDLLALELGEKKPAMTYACGPVAMLKSVAALSEAHQVPCQVSLESAMACGMGACLGCAVENSLKKDKYAHVCVDGPVFDLSHFRF